MPAEKQITHRSQNHVLTNINVWSPDRLWLVYDTRSDREGTRFDGTTIEAVNVETGEVRTLYMSRNSAHCGVVTFHPCENKAVFILGPENPLPDWQYGPAHRQGVIVNFDNPGQVTNLDARNLTPPFTPGALRGGSHVHVFSPDGAWVSFTYNDAVLPSVRQSGEPGDIDQRNVGVGVFADKGVHVPRSQPRNHDGQYFAVLATRTTTHPAPGSDEIGRASEEGWIGTQGYRKTDGTWQSRSLAFQGEVMTERGETISEVFIVDLPDDVAVSSDKGPLEGTAMMRPLPPRGTVQRRLTRTAQRKFPGIQGPRHWLRSSPDGTQIAFLMRDDAGNVQIWTISPNGGEPRQITHDRWGVTSAFSWSPDSTAIAYIADKSVFVVQVTGGSRRLTVRTSDKDAPLPLACVYSPGSRQIAYLRPVLDKSTGRRSNQIFVVSV